MAAAPAAQVAVRFVLYEQEVTPEVVQEAQLHRDIILVRDGDSATDYRSIVHKTWAFVEVGFLGAAGFLGAVFCVHPQRQPGAPPCALHPQVGMGEGAAGIRISSSAASSSTVHKIWACVEVCFEGS